jgi:hypothetical protein
MKGTSRDQVPSKVNVEKHTSIKDLMNYLLTASIQLINICYQKCTNQIPTHSGVHSK